MAGVQILETERLLLREFDEGDIESFYRLGSIPEVTRYTHDPGGGLTSLEHAREVLRTRPLADYKKHGYGRWACVYKATNEVIGFAGLKYLDEMHEIDLGYRFLPDYWGRGLATEACRAVLDFGFAQLGLKQIIAMVDPQNVASVRVLTKLGMTFVGMVEDGSLLVAKYVACPVHGHVA